MKDFIKHYKIKCKVRKVKREDARFLKTQMVELLEDRTVYKKLQDGVIATLVIPKHTIIHIPRHHMGCKTYIQLRKCRAEYAIVKTLSDKREKGLSSWDCTVYTKHEFVFPNKFDKRLWTCAGGIHFFFSRSDAKIY